jgi:hypothetical protein
VLAAGALALAALVAASPWISRADRAAGPSDAEAAARGAEVPEARPAVPPAAAPPA